MKAGIRSTSIFYYGRDERLTFQIVISLRGGADDEQNGNPQVQRGGFPYKTE
jgi:hypothetical protein